MCNKASDPIHRPAHYTVYPVEPIEITRYLGFCLGNAVKYVLQAPYKGGVEDCLKAKMYVAWDAEAPMLSQLPLAAIKQISLLRRFFEKTPGDQLWRDIAEWQNAFLTALTGYLDYDNLLNHFCQVSTYAMTMDCCIDQLRRVLALRDTTGQIYEGMSGLPNGRETV